MKAIQVENLSKSCFVGHNNARAESYTALRDVLARNTRNLARKTRDRLPGRQIAQGDEVEEFWAIKDITTTFNPANAVGIIGRNGAGKSTGLKILTPNPSRSWRGELNAYPSPRLCRAEKHLPQRRHPRHGSQGNRDRRLGKGESRAQQMLMP